MYESEMYKDIQPEKIYEANRTAKHFSVGRLPH